MIENSDTARGQVFWYIGHYIYCCQGDRLNLNEEIGVDENTKTPPFCIEISPIFDLLSQEHFGIVLKVLFDQRKFILLFLKITIFWT